MTTGASLTRSGSDARRTYDPGILEIKVEGMDGLIAHATVTLGEREDWLIEFTAWTGSTMGSSWCTWVFVEGSARRRDLTAYYDNEGEWVRLGGVLLDDLSPTFAILNDPEVEEDVFDLSFKSSMGRTISQSLPWTTTFSWTTRRANRTTCLEMSGTNSTGCQFGARGAGQQPAVHMIAGGTRTDDWVKLLLDPLSAVLYALGPVGRQAGALTLRLRESFSQGITRVRSQQTWPAATSLARGALARLGLPASRRPGPETRCGTE